MLATDPLLLDRLTAVLTDGALVNLTVPCDESPPFTLVGLRLNDARLTPPELCEVMVSVALCVVPP
jgi:hypothetical protein